MSSVDQASETQLANIEKKTGQDRQALFAAVLGQGLAKHGEMLAWAKAHLGLGHGDANALVLHARRSAEPQVDAAASADPLDALYTGARAGQRPIHEALTAAIDAFGPYETALKKGYVSLRRKKQFAMIGPKTSTQLELGLNSKEPLEHVLLKALPPGGMCHYAARLESAGQIDDALIAAILRAYEAAG